MQAEAPSFLLSMGTRPEIIKMAPVYLELQRRGARTMLLHTGQHSDMAAPLYNLFGITPDLSIPLDRNASPDAPVCDLAALSSLLLAKISSALTKLNPDTVLVHGDTSSALMTALAAFYQQRPVAHVEAGLRSHNMAEPFPEEMNRTLVAQLSHWHFAPTPRAEANLLNEGVRPDAIHVVGNTIVDALQSINLESANDKLIEKIKPHLPAKKLILVTAHRRENHGAGIASIAHAVAEMLTRYTDIVAVWPVHPNPKVSQSINLLLESLSPEVASRLYLAAPLDYPALLWMLKNSWLVLTDSGGIQEEAVALSIPVLVLRDATERPEVIESGLGQLVGTKAEAILAMVAKYYDFGNFSTKNVKNPYGNGDSAKKICDIFLKNVK